MIQCLLELKQLLNSKKYPNTETKMHELTRELEDYHDDYHITTDF